METGYIVGGQCIYNVQPATQSQTKQNKMEDLIKRIEHLMSDNEIVKNNAIKAMVAKSGNEEMCTRYYSTAKTENQAYQNVLNIIKQLK